MKFTVVILTAAFCLNARAESSIDQRSDDAIIAAAEQLIAEGEAGTSGGKTEAKEESGDGAEAKAVEATDERTEANAEGKSLSATIASFTGHGAAEDNRKESEIPVVLSSAKESKSDSQIIWRLVASIGVIAVVAGGFMYAGKRWTRHKDKGGSAARIEIMHQMHLGPRRSVALIRVSGETMLIGITDHNVNMIKAVTLIDDELESMATKDFNGFLEDEFSIEDVRNALGPTAMR